MSGASRGGAAGTSATDFMRARVRLTSCGHSVWALDARTRCKQYERTPWKHSMHALHAGGSWPLRHSGLCGRHAARPRLPTAACCGIFPLPTLQVPDPGPQAAACRPRQRAGRAARAERCDAGAHPQSPHRHSKGAARARGRDAWHAVGAWSIQPGPESSPLAPLQGIFAREA
eukprot:181318-Chlamydomonas_euryale.AAC.1